MHSLEIIGYFHPNEEVARLALDGYLDMVHNLHLNPETREHCWERLTEDRIANNNVVS